MARLPLAAIMPVFPGWASTLAVVVASAALAPGRSLMMGAMSAWILAA
ncbi:MAG TPA: hypothetical protein VFQ44_27125 [Streptosporangiaceae bacterium]|nr:hypothetical protein [Streptosporangiaceae bacterium]